MEDTRDSRRARELVAGLVERFGLPEDTVREAVLAVAGAIEDRLPRGVRAAFVSWMPQSWELLQPAADAPCGAPVRGLVALKERVTAAGVPPEHALPFVAEMVRFLGQRCGTPLAEALRRKVPEIAAIEQNAGLLVTPTGPR